MKRLILGAALTAALFAGPALAQPASAAASGEPSARTLELSHRLMTALHMDATMAGVMRSMIPQMVDVEARRIPNFRPEWRQPLIEAEEETMAELTPGLIKHVEEVYARGFTEEELTRAVGFYESPAGQSMVSKLPAMTGEAMQGLADFAARAGEGTKARFCKKIGGCDKLGAQAGRPASP